MTKISLLVLATAMILVAAGAFATVTKAFAGATETTNGHFNPQHKCVGNPHDGTHKQGSSDAANPHGDGKDEPKTGNPHDCDFIKK